MLINPSSSHNLALKRSLLSPVFPSPEPPKNPIAMGGKLRASLPFLSLYFFPSSFSPLIPLCRRLRCGSCFFLWRSLYPAQTCSSLSLARSCFCLMFLAFLLLNTLSTGLFHHPSCSLCLLVRFLD
jgi:hypothetical protein